MSIKKKIRSKLFESITGQILFYKLRTVREKLALITASDFKYIKKAYRKRFGENIDLANPQGFGEKLQWLKLFYRDDWMPICTDKYEIRKYLQTYGYENLANRVIGIYDDAKNIPFDQLPQKFVAKATHGSGWNLICEDKNALNWGKTVKLLNMWLKLNLYVFGREWNYKNLKPRIIVEEFINHKPLNDYKLMCFNGEPLYVQLNNDYNGHHYVDFYDIQNWDHLNFTYESYANSDRNIEKPKKLDEMIEIARTLSNRFPFVRVDFYQFDDTILIGEMTFFPSGGLWPFIPAENGYSALLGGKLSLPAANNNLDLLEKIAKK